MQYDIIQAEPGIRPRLKLPFTVLDWALTVISSIIFIYSCSNAYNQLGRLPDYIPTHYNQNMAPDFYTFKGNLILYPFFQCLICFSINLIALFPHLFSYFVRITPDNARKQYLCGRMHLRMIGLFLQIFMVYMEKKILHYAEGYTNDFSSYNTFGLLGAILTSFLIYILISKAYA